MLIQMRVNLEISVWQLATSLVRTLARVGVILPTVMMDDEEGPKDDDGRGGWVDGGGGRLRGDVGLLVEPFGRVLGRLGGVAGTP